MPASVEDRMRQLGLNPKVPSAPKVKIEEPDRSWKKDDIKAWLDLNAAGYSSHMNKDELLELVEGS